MNNNNDILSSVPSQPPGSPQRKRTLSESSNSSNSKRSCSIDNSSSPSPSESINNNNNNSSNLASSVGSLQASKLNLMDHVETPPPHPLQVVVSPEQEGDDPFDDANTTLRASSSTLHDEEELSDEAASPPSYTSSPSPVMINRPDPQTQIEIIKDFKSTDLIQGESWFLVSREWYRKWETVCSGIAESKDDDMSLTVEDIGGIDNSKITDENNELKPAMVEGVDVIVLPRPSWEMLKTWYGVKGQTFERQVASRGSYNSVRIEFYSPTFQFQILLPSTSPSSTEPLPPLVSLFSGSTLKELKDHAKIAFGLDSTSTIRLWTLSDTSIPEQNFILTDRLSSEIGVDLVEKEDDRINDDSLLSDSLLDNQMNRIVVEQEQANGKWLVDASQIVSSTPTTATTQSTVPVEKKKLFGSAGNFFNKMESTNVLIPRNKSATASTSKGVSIAVPSNSSGSFLSSLSGALTRTKSAGRNNGQRGLTGLQNLGNTCFMNSALQCMSNTKELQEYFTSGVYKNELNPDNPLGMNGQVAEAFGQLIERLWSNSGSSVAPREFKQALSKFAPSFSGYGQQDSQELLAFLLDGTHEDLNRIKVKPATNAPDWIMGGGDQELVDLARTCWEQYRSRNDSVIVDLFQGQYRSTVVCPDCSKVSITFDPFMYITTNLPVFKKWSGKVFFIPLDVTKMPVEITLELPQKNTLKGAKMAIGSFMGVDGKKLIVCEAWKSKFWKAWYDDDMITEVQVNDTILFFETTIAFPQLKPRHYGKVKPVPIPVATDPEPPVIVVVYNSCTKSSSSKVAFKKAMNSHDERFGLPFILTLTRAEACTKEGIQAALSRQYARYTKRGQELLGLEEEEDGDVMDTSRHDTPGSPPPPPPSAFPPTPPPESMDIDEPVHTMPTPPAEDPFDNIIKDVLPSLSPSSTPTPVLPSTKRTNPFEIFVSKEPKANGVLPLADNDCPDYPIPLEARRSRRRASSPDIFASPSTTSLPGSYNNPIADIIIDSPTAETNAVEDLPPLELTPIIVTGDTIITEWTPAAREYYFGSEQTLWEDVETFVDPAAVESARKAKDGRKQSINIEDCLREFTKEERLGEDDTWYCPDCKKHQQATKKVEIWKVPDVLVFALKRFSASRYSRDKLDDLVTFPVEGFNMEPFVEGDKVERRLAMNGSVIVDEAESLIYDLYAVDNHYGGMGGGHYTAYAKNHENGRWYDFDDSRVLEISETKIQTSAAYLLFYRRRTARPIGAKSRELVDSALQSRAASAVVSRGVSPAASNRHSRNSSIEVEDSVSFGPDFSTFRPLSDKFTAASFSSTTPTSFTSSIHNLLADEEAGYVTSFDQPGSDRAEPGTPRSDSPFVMNGRPVDEEYDNDFDIDPTCDVVPLPSDSDNEGAEILGDDSSYVTVD